MKITPKDVIEFIAYAVFIVFISVEIFFIAVSFLSQEWLKLIIALVIAIIVVYMVKDEIK